MDFDESIKLKWERRPCPFQKFVTEDFEVVATNKSAPYIEDHFKPTLSQMIDVWSPARS